MLRHKFLESMTINLPCVINRVGWESGPCIFPLWYIVLVHIFYHTCPMKQDVMKLILELGQCSRLKSSMPFKRDLALQNIPLSKQPFKTQPQIENEDVTRSPQYNLPATITTKRRALSLQETQLH